jgi:hypothetical protein
MSIFFHCYVKTTPGKICGKKRLVGHTSEEKNISLVGFLLKSSFNKMVGPGSLVSRSCKQLWKFNHFPAQQGRWLLNMDKDES